MGRALPSTRLGQGLPVKGIREARISEAGFRGSLFSVPQYRDGKRMGLSLLGQERPRHKLPRYIISVHMTSEIGSSIE